MDGWMGNYTAFSPAEPSACDGEKRDGRREGRKERIIQPTSFTSKPQRAQHVRGTPPHCRSYQTPPSLPPSLPPIHPRTLRHMPPPHPRFVKRTAALLSRIDRPVSHHDMQRAQQELAATFTPRDLDVSAPEAAFPFLHVVNPGLVARLQEVKLDGGSPGGTRTADRCGWRGGRGGPFWTRGNAEGTAS